jgi:hypothetical protein
VIDRLAASAAKIVTTLDRLLDCQNPSVAVAAARTILQGMIAMREPDELVDRVEALVDLQSGSPRS